MQLKVCSESTKEDNLGRLKSSNEIDGNVKKVVQVVLLALKALILVSG